MAYNGVIFPCFAYNNRNTAFSQSMLRFSKCYFNKIVSCLQLFVGCSSTDISFRVLQLPWCPTSLIKNMQRWTKQNYGNKTENQAFSRNLLISFQASYQDKSKTRYLIKKLTIIKNWSLKTILIVFFLGKLYIRLHCINTNLYWYHVNGINNFYMVSILINWLLLFMYNI